MSTWPIEDLEQRAIDERRQLDKCANELESRVKIARDKLDIARQARRHFGGAALVLGALALLSGYAAAGLFTRH